MLLEGKTAVVTGCNRGIGKAILSRFAENGCKVIFAVIRKRNDEFENYIKSLSQQTGCTIHAVFGDFSSDAEIQAAAKEIFNYKTPVDILVNNVGANYTQKSFSMIRKEEIVDTMQVNFISHLQFTQTLSRLMVKSSDASIIFMSSAAAFDGGGNIAYVSSKAAILGAAKRLAIEYGKLGIRVNTIAPGVTATEMTDVLTEEDMESAFQMQIMHRIGRPEEIADAAVFLASSLSSFITGQVIHVDGGIK